MARLGSSSRNYNLAPIATPFPSWRLPQRDPWAIQRSVEIKSNFERKWGGEIGNGVRDPDRNPWNLRWGGCRPERLLWGSSGGGCPLRRVDWLRTPARQMGCRLVDEYSSLHKLRSEECVNHLRWTSPLWPSFVTLRALPIALTIFTLSSPAQDNVLGMRWIG